MIIDIHKLLGKNSYRKLRIIKFGVFITILYIIRIISFEFYYKNKKSLN